MDIIFIKPLEKSPRIMYNKQCNQLSNIMIYDQNIQKLYVRYLTPVRAFVFGRYIPYYK